MLKNMKMLWILLFALAIVLAACGGEDASSDSGTNSGTDSSDDTSEDDIKIGIIGAFQLTAGAEIEDAAKLAIKEINESGGIDGRQIDAYYYDTKADPEEGRTVVERLLYQDEVDFIIGDHRSEVALAIQPIVMEAEKLYFNVGSASPNLTQNVVDDYDLYKYFFSTQLDSNQLADGFIAHFKAMVEEQGFERVALIGESAIWVDPVEEMFMEEFGDKVALVERPATDTEDFSIELSRAQDNDVEAVMQVFSADQGIIFAQQWADRQIPVWLAGYNVQAQSGDFWDQTGGNAQGLMTWKHGVRAEITEMTVPYWDNFTEEYGRIPGAYPGLNTYDSIHILAQAIEEAGTTDTDTLVDTLESGSFTGAGGIIEFNDRHGITVGEELVPFTLIQWQDGEAITVWPEAQATGEVIAPDWIND